MRRSHSCLFSICLFGAVSTVAVSTIANSAAQAQQVRSLKRSASPDQWLVSYSLKNSPDDFKFDTIQPSELDANNRAVALRAWSAHTPVENYEWKLAVILITAERKNDGPTPAPSDSDSSRVALPPSQEPAVPNLDVSSKTSTKPESIAIELPEYSRYLKNVDSPTLEGYRKVAGKKGTGTLGSTRVLVEFDGDGVMRIKDPDGKLLSVGTWLQSGSEVSLATASYVYIGNVGVTQAKGIRLRNGPRLGTDEEEWSLELTTANPLVGTWRLTSRKEGKYAGDKEEFYSTTLVLRLDHSAYVDWSMTSSRKDWNAKERVTDFDRSTATWEERDGKVHFSNPKIIRNWRGKDVKWSWFDPANPLNTDSLMTWERIR